MLFPALKMTAELIAKPRGCPHIDLARNQSSARSLSRFHFGQRIGFLKHGNGGDNLGSSQTNRRRGPQKRTPILPVLCLFALVVFGVAYFLGQTEVPTIKPYRPASRVPIIDPGHGGEDGGASSIHGTLESGLNLQISMKLNEIMHFLGIPSIILRETDISLHDSSAKTLREKKNSDLKNRANKINSISNGLLLSVHQNTFTNSKYFGLQSFYAPGPGSKEIALLVQKNAKTYLDTENTRSAKPVNKDLYLMNAVNVPAVLIECGFISNAKDERNLLDGAYQTRLATMIAASYVQWTETLP